RLRGGREPTGAERGRRRAPPAEQASARDLDADPSRRTRAPSVAGTPTRPAARAVAALAVCSPSRPVHALAFPACTSTADNLPPATRRRAICTGAAGARHNVNTPAATTGGFATMSATSGPRLFSPHRTPAKDNP